MNTATETATEHARSRVEPANSHLSASIQNPVIAVTPASTLTDKAREPSSGGRSERPLRRAAVPRQSMDFDDLPDGSINRTSYNRPTSSTSSRISADGSSVESEASQSTTQIKDQIDEAFTAYVNGYVSGEMPLLDAVSHLCKLYPPVPVEMRWRHWVQPDNPLGFKAPATNRLQTLDEKTYRREVMRMFHKRMVEALSKARKQAREKHAQLAREQGFDTEGSATYADDNAIAEAAEQSRGARRVYKCYVRRVGDGSTAASREREPEWLAHVTVAKDSFYPAAAVDIIRAALEGTPMPLSIPDALAMAQQTHVAADPQAQAHALAHAQAPAEPVPQPLLPARTHAPTAGPLPPVALSTVPQPQQALPTRKRRSKAASQPSRTPPAPAHAAAAPRLQVTLAMAMPVAVATPTPTLAHGQGPLPLATLPSVSLAALADVSLPLIHAHTQAALQATIGRADAHRLAATQPLPLHTLPSQLSATHHAQIAPLSAAAQAPPQTAVAPQPQPSHRTPAAAATPSARVPSRTRTRMPKPRAPTPAPASASAPPSQEPPSLFAAGVAVRAVSAEEQERAMQDMLRLLREPVALAAHTPASASPPAASAAAEASGVAGAANGDGCGAAADAAAGTGTGTGMGTGTGEGPEAGNEAGGGAG